jgi:hypothetical protein
VGYTASDNEVREKILTRHNKNRPTLGFMQEGIVHFTLNLPGAFPGDFDI